MIPFDPANPYPCLPPGLATYAEEQEHSARVDDWLGFRIHDIEARLLQDQKRAGAPHHDQQPWIGLPIQAMLTPYTELREMLGRLQPAPGQRVVDLGAGYGRMGLVLARHFPETRFTGYELIEARVVEGLRVLARAGAGPRIRLLPADLSAGDFSPEPAHFYFIYDYGTRAAIAKTLEDLRATARRAPITVVGRGRASRDAIERQAPWLSQVHPPEHHGRYSIYRS